MDPGPLHRRRRPAIACTECRRRKISCDLLSPCGPCWKSRSKLRCVYNNGNGNNTNTNNNSGRSRSGTVNNTNNVNPEGGSSDDFGRLHSAASEVTAVTGSAESDVVRPGLPETERPPETDLGRDQPAADQPHGPHLLSDLDENVLGGVDTSELVDTIFFTGSTCFDMDNVNCSETQTPHHKPGPSSNSSSGASWDTGAGLGFQFPSVSGCKPLDSRPERYPTWPQCLGYPEAAPWRDPALRCEDVRRLLREYAAAGTSDGNELESAETRHSGSETARPVMEFLAKLERAAWQEREKEAASTPLGSWAGPTAMDSAASAAKNLLPARAQCDVLVRAYIQTFHSLLPVLHVPSWLQGYERFWELPAAQLTGSDEIFICNMVLVVTLGSHAALDPLAPTAASQCALQQQITGRISFVRNRLTRHIVSEHRSSLGLAQTMCLLALTGMIRPQRGSLTGADFLLGDYDLTRIGFQMGLHRRPSSHAANMSTEDAEMRRRLWATMLELSLQRCFDNRLPAPLTPECYDCEPPSGIAEEDGVEDRCFAILEMLTKTQRLRLRILDILNAPNSPKTYEQSHQLAAELNEACNANIAVLRAMPPSPHRAFQMHMMDMFTRPFVLALHSPFADQASVTKPGYYYSRIMRMELSVQLLALPLDLGSALQKNSVFDRGSSSASSSFASSSCQFLGDPAAGKQQVSQADAASPTTHGGPMGMPGLGSTGTACLSNATILSGDTLVVEPEALPDPYTWLLLNGHGHYAHARRQITAALFLDLIKELEENAFPTLQGASRQVLRGVLRDVVRIFERRVVCAAGAHSIREFVLFTAAAAYVDGLLLGDCSRRGRVGVNQNLVSHSPDFHFAVDKAVACATTKALALSAEVVDRTLQRGNERGQRMW